MDVSSIIAEIDAEIAKLQNARATLTGLSGSSVAGAVKTGRRGRPKGSKNAPKAASVQAKAAKPAKRAKRKLSAEGRKRIVEAMKRRWAEKRKDSGK